jgi:3',5'-nucleoside bisphosphate phosphatase
VPNEYKINIHCHTIFSDGLNTPVTLAHEAKRLGFCALVITDHYYGSEFQ